MLLENRNIRENLLQGNSLQLSNRNCSKIKVGGIANIIFTQTNTYLTHLHTFMLYFKYIFLNSIGAVGNEEEGSTEDKDAADEEEQERLEALREAEERRKEKHRKMEEEREKMRQEIRDKVIVIQFFN